MRQSSTKDTVTTVVRCRMTRHTPACRCMASRTRCTAFSALIRYSGKVQVRVGYPTRRRTSAFTLPTATGKPCTTRCSTSCTTIRVDRAEATRHFLNGMFMGMAQRALGEGTFGLRAMLSPDPFMGANGYPLIFATGETADGRTHLIDRQHPHDLFMELATTYSYAFNKNSSVYVYAGLPGEPALGPSAFMHRTSGMDIPEAPITHHWLDSTHITFGVLTAGVVLDTWKLEASAFKGREPDQYRYDIEAPKLDSYSARISWNPIRELSFQVSWGHLKSPEGLDPDKNEDRFTVSAIYTQPFGNDNIWSTTLAWGRKMMKPGDTLDGFILETAAIFQKKYTLFARAERVQENELLDLEPAPVFTVNKLTVGGIYDFFRTDHAKFGVGGLVSFYGVPDGLKSSLRRPYECDGVCEVEDRMNKLVTYLNPSCCRRSVALAHEGHEHATGVVRERMELMTSMGQRMLASKQTTSRQQRVGQAFR